MRIHRIAWSLTLVASLLALAACGSSSDSGEGSDRDAPRTTTTSAAPPVEGDAITEPICDFAGITADDATRILGISVTTASAVGSNDPSGGSCTLTPPGSEEPAVSIAVFPDTEASFESFLAEYSTKPSPTGRPLWTRPVELTGVGRVAYTFESPDGGFESVWAFADGYRVLVSNRNTTDVPGAAERLQVLAEEAVSNL